VRTSRPSSAATSNAVRCPHAAKFTTSLAESTNCPSLRCILLQRSRGGLLDGLEHRQRTIGVIGSHGASGLGLDRDGRHVVADRVVQFAGELVAQAQLGLLDVTETGVGVEADRCAERGSEQEEPVPGDHLVKRCPVSDVGDREPNEDGPEAEDGLTASPPAQQGVGQDQRCRDAVQSSDIDGNDPCELERDQGAERDRDRGERAGAPPQKTERDHDAGCERDRQPRTVLAQHHLESRSRQNHGE
jgi:hypothetical protein